MAEKRVWKLASAAMSAFAGTFTARPSALV